MKIINRLKQEAINAIYNISCSFTSVKNNVTYDVPYVCQFAHPDHAELSLKNTLDAVDDPFWESTGADSAERYAQWAFTMCGMASFSMALQYFINKTIPPALLAEDALKRGVYHTDTDEVLSAMKYREFATWTKEYGLHAKVITRLSVKGIQKALSEGCLVIISVNPNIREYVTAPKNQIGGHLVVVTGYDKDNDIIIINNPSGFVSLDTQVRHKIPLAQFKSQYAGRGIIISK